MRKNDMPKTPDELADAIFGKEEEKKVEQPKKKALVSKTQVEEVKSTLKLVSEVYEGECSKYIVTNNVLTISINHQFIKIKKSNLSKLISELNELGGLI